MSSETSQPPPSAPPSTPAGVLGSLAALRQRIEGACARAGRDAGAVRIVAVTKAHPAAAARACLQAGLVDLGENYVQDWLPKVDALGAHAPPPRWHFIGSLQSRKAKSVAEHAWALHSLDRASLVDALAGRLTAAAPLRVFVQVNIAAEPQKGGCRPDEAAELVRAAACTGVLLPVGLMTVAPDVDDAEAARPVFAALRALRDDIQAGLEPSAAAAFTELSMGMSHDLEVAVEEGATWVRVGSALLGPRPTHAPAQG